ncbi:MAG: hypothetical protein ACOYKE_12485 [Ferruginibacter sp.]
MKAKHLFLLGTLIIFLQATHAQVSISSDGSAPHSSAMLEVKSTTKGLLLPRSSNATITAISTGKSGLLMYDTTNSQVMLNVSGGAGTWRPLLDTRTWIRSVANGRNYTYTLDSIGIGTTVPSTKLQIWSINTGEQLRLGDYSPQISFYSLISSGIQQAGFVNATGGDMKFGTAPTNTRGRAMIRVNGADRLIVDSTGNVGIGTTSPDALFDVYSATSGEIMRVGYNSPQISFYSNGASGIIQTGYVNATGYDMKLGTVIGNTAGRVILRTGGTDRVTVDSTGYVGMGIGSPETRLHLSGGQDCGLNNTSNGYLMIGAINGNNIIIDNNEIMCRNAVASSSLILQNDGGTVRIGSVAVPTGYTFAVDGKAICTEMRVQLSAAWPDYVFDDQYQLLNFNQLRNYITENKHLPNIPAAKEVQNSGIDLGEFQRKSIEKIEELTLYILQLENRLKALENNSASNKIRQ